MESSIGTVLPLTYALTELERRDHGTQRDPEADMSRFVGTKVYVILMALVSALVLASGAGATDGPDSPQERPESESWQFSLKPYLFLSGLSGSITAGDVTFPINSSFSELVDNLRVGAFLSLAGVKGSWGFLADVEYIGLQGEGSGKVPVELRLDTVVGELDATYSPANDSNLRFVGGVRLFDVSQSLLIADEPTAEAKVTVVDPVLGAVGTWDVADSILFQMRGDIGGFGVGSEFTYQLMLEFQWRLSDSLGLPFGYRVLGYQIQKESVQLDTRLGGLFLGLDYRF